MPDAHSTHPTAHGPEDRRARALAALRGGASVTEAARRGSLSRQHVHRLLRTEAAFREAQHAGRRARELARWRRRIEAREGRRKLRISVTLDAETWGALRRQAHELGVPFELAGEVAVANGVRALDEALGGS